MNKSFKYLLPLSLILNIILAGGLFYLVQRLGGVKFMLHRINSGGLAGIYENRNDLFNYLKLEKGDIIFLGDSITEYGQWEELMAHPKVKNRGIAGDTSWGLMRRLDGITESQPSSIFLMIGVNDFLFTNNREIIDNYHKIVQQIKTQAPECQLILQSILPINAQEKNTVFDNKRILEVNQAIQSIAKSEGLVYLDIHQKLLDDDGQLAAKFTADGVHINGKAYSIWKSIVTPYILKI